MTGIHHEEHEEHEGVEMSGPSAALSRIAETPILTSVLAFVLFTFLAERCERRSVMPSSNLVFSKWDQIFKDPMTTMAAVDRLGW